MARCLARRIGSGGTFWVVLRADLVHLTVSAGSWQAFRFILFSFWSSAKDGGVCAPDPSICSSRERLALLRMSIHRNAHSWSRCLVSSVIWFAPDAADRRDVELPKRASKMRQPTTRAVTSRRDVSQTRNAIISKSPRSICPASHFSWHVAAYQPSLCDPTFLGLLASGIRPRRDDAPPNVAAFSTLGPPAPRQLWAEAIAK